MNTVSDFIILQSYSRAMQSVQNFAFVCPHTGGSLDCEDSSLRGACCSREIQRPVNFRKIFICRMFRE